MGFTVSRNIFTYLHLVETVYLLAPKYLEHIVNYIRVKCGVLVCY